MKRPALKRPRNCRIERRNVKRTMRLERLENRSLLATFGSPLDWQPAIDVDPFLPQLVAEAGANGFAPENATGQGASGSCSQSVKPNLVLPVSGGDTLIGVSEPAVDAAMNALVESGVPNEVARGESGVMPGPAEFADAALTAMNGNPALVNPANGGAPGHAKNDQGRAQNAEPRVFVDDAEVVEEGHAVSFRIRIDPPSEAPVTVHYRTQDGTAIGNQAIGTGDYHTTDRHNTLVFLPGEREKTIVVATNDDTQAEPTEKFHLEVWKVSSPRPIRISDGVGTAKIRDNDGGPTDELANATGGGGNGKAEQDSQHRDAEQQNAENAEQGIRSAQADGAAQQNDAASVLAESNVEEVGDQQPESPAESRAVVKNSKSSEDAEKHDSTADSTTPDQTLDDCIHGMVRANPQVPAEPASDTDDASYRLYVYVDQQELISHVAIGLQGPEMDVVFSFGGKRDNCSDVYSSKWQRDKWEKYTNSWYQQESQDAGIEIERVAIPVTESEFQKIVDALFSLAESETQFALPQPTMCTRTWLTIRHILEESSGDEGAFASFFGGYSVWVDAKRIQVDRTEHDVSDAVGLPKDLPVRDIVDGVVAAKEGRYGDALMHGIDHLWRSYEWAVDWKR